MRRQSQIAFAIVASLLVVTVAPGSAANTQATDGLVVGSEHTTDSDFQNAQLENLTVDGTGEEASVVLSSQSVSLVEGFEDGDTTEWSGDAGISAQTTTVYEGSYAGKASSSYSAVASTRVDSTVYNEQGDTIEVWTRAQNNGFFYFGVQSESNASSISGYEVRTNPSGGDFQLVRWDDGNQTTLDSSGSSSSNTWYRSVINWGEDGTIDVSVYNTNGIQVASLSETDNNYTSGGIGYGLYNGDAWIDSVSITRNVDSGTYVSEQHNVSNASQAAINITAATDVSINATVRTDGGATLATATITSTGNHTVNLSDTSSSRLETVLNVTVTGSNPAFSMADESILFTPHAPQASNATPEDNATLTSQSATLSVDVNDSDFATAQGDSVGVSFFANGEQVGTETLTSNGTASTTIDAVGETDWYAVLNDSYGQTTRTENRTLLTPSTLRIYNESSPSQLVDNATLTIRFLFQGEEDRVVTREVSDGKTNFTELPKDVPFIISVQSDDYRPRRIYVPSLYETQEVYLLPTSAEYVSPVFSLEDYTGRFTESSTVLVIRRPINGSWKRVQADYFGSTDEVSAMLEYNVRHRLYLHNTETGARRFLGKYTPISSGQKTLRVTSQESIVVQRSNALTQVDPSTRTLSATNDTSVTVEVDEQAAALDSWSVNVTYTNSTTTETLTTLSRSGPDGGTVSPTLDLANYSGGTVTVRVSYVIDGAEYHEVTTFRVQQHYDNQFSLLSVLVDGVADRIPDGNMDQFTTLLSAFLSIFFATAVAASRMHIPTEGIGLAALGALSAFAIIGWVPYPLIFAGGITWVSFAALRRGL